MLILPADQSLPAAEHRGPLPDCVVDEAFPHYRKVMRSFPGSSSPEKGGFSITICPGAGCWCKMSLPSWRLSEGCTIEVHPEVTEMGVKESQIPRVGGVLY